MKKLLKAVALATVMCMLLSTAAFATEVELPRDQDKDTVTVNVMTTPNEQVVLLIVDGDVTDLAAVTDAQIQFIDQVQADSEGMAEFGEVTVKTPDSKVDVWVGYAGVSPRKLGDDIDLKKVEGITIASGESAIITATGTSEGGAMTGYAAALTVTIPENLTVSRMIWSFQLKGETLRRYSKAQAVDGATGGDVQFAAAFTLGATADAYEVTDVSAIFFTGDPDSDEDKADPTKTHYLNDADKAQKENQKAN